MNRFPYMSIIIIILKSKKIELNSEEYHNYINLFKTSKVDIKNEISKDFKVGKVLDVDGWVLSNTECHYIVMLAANKIL